MWNRDLCIPRFIASSKKVGSPRAGTCTRLAVRRSFTNSRAPDESNSRPRKRAGIDCVSQSLKCDKPHKSQYTQGTKVQKAQRKPGKEFLEMKWLNILRDRIRAMRQREDVINDIDREMRLHLEMQTHANISAGMSPAEAREKAMRSFGNLNRAVDAAYDVKGGGLFETLAQDIRYGVRMLAKHKAFTSIAVITLALGIGANTAIFSVVNELLLRPLPYRDADRVVTVWEVTPEGRHQNTTSRANFRAWKNQSTSYEYISAFTDQRFNLTGNGEPEELSVQFATLEFFKALGVDPILGRTFVTEDREDGRSPVAVLSYGLWQRRFGGQSSVVGQPIELGGFKFTVIGVMPPNFQFHIKQRSGTGRPAELWTVLPMATGQGANERGRFLGGVARLKDGVTPEGAAAELRTIESRLSDEVPQF